MSNRGIAAVILLVLFSAEAQAQCCGNFGEVSSGSSIRVQSQLSLSVPIANSASQTDEIKTVEESRDRLLEISSRECAVLKQRFNADCRISSMSISSQIGSRGLDRSAQVSTANTYELKIKP